MAIPRIGQEVIVEFLEGDPDQPIVTGRIYHDVNRTPYRLPEHKTRMTIKSKTHKGTGFNELRFEDEKGVEEIFIHAERDMNEIVENDKTEIIGKHSLLKIEGSQDTSIYGSRNDAVHKNSSNTIGGDFSLNIGVDMPTYKSISSFQIDSSHLGLKTKAIYKNPLDKKKGDGNFHLTTVENVSFNIGGSFYQRLQESFSLEAEDNISILSANETLLSSGRLLNLVSNGKIFTASGENITLRCGASEITLNKQGEINIKGVTININGKRINLN